LLFIPVLFIVVSIIFPLTIAATDMCAASGTLMFNSGPAISNVVCGNSIECAFDLPIVNETLTFDVQQAVGDILIGTSSGQEAELTKVFETLGKVAKGFLNTSITEALADPIAQGFIAVFPGIEVAAAGLAELVPEGVQAIGSVFDASSLNKIFVGIQEILCCGLFGSMYSFFLFLYIFCFATLVCLFPGSFVRMMMGELDEGEESNWLGEFYSGPAVQNEQVEMAIQQVDLYNLGPLPGYEDDQGTSGPPSRGGGGRHGRNKSTASSSQGTGGVVTGGVYDPTITQQQAAPKRMRNKRNKK